MENKPIYLNESNLERYGYLKDGSLILVPLYSSIFMEVLNALIQNDNLPVKIEGELKMLPCLSEIVPVIIIKRAETK